MSDIDDLNIALLRLGDTEGRALPEEEEKGEAIRFGRLIGLGRRNCEVTGFPYGGSKVVTARRITGVIDPGSFPRADVVAVELSQHIEMRGFGGAGVCSEGNLVGIITQYSKDENIFLIVPVTRILGNAEFRGVIRKELGRDVEVVQLATPEKDLSDAIKSVSKADPSNIQEVAAAQLALSNLYYENVLSQARRSFNAAAIAAIGGSFFFLAAIIFAIVAKQLTASLISSVGGAVVEVVSGLNFWLYARTSVQLNSFHMRLERMQRYLVANSVAASLTGEQRESTLAKLVMSISEGEPRRESIEASLSKLARAWLTCRPRRVTRGALGYRGG